MKKYKRPMSARPSSMHRSWLPGGPSRIAYEQRMQDKKTMDHRTSQPASPVIGHHKVETALNAAHVYRAACVLLMQKLDKPTGAERLIAAGDALLGDAA